MSPHKKALEETLNHTKDVNSFEHFHTLINQHNIKFEFIYDPNEEPGFFYFEASEERLAENLSFVINTFYSADEIPLFLVHEFTHIDQKSFLKNNFNRIHDYNITSQIGYTLLDESHAYANQNEFLVKNYIQNIDNKTNRKCFSEQSIKNIYKETKHIRTKNKKTNIMEHEVEYDYTSYLFNHYLNGLRRDNVYIPTNDKDAIKIMTNFHKNASESTYQKAFIEGRQHVFKGFFDIHGNNTRGLVPFVNEYIDEYISEILEEAEEDQNNSCTNIQSGEMPINLAVSTLLTDNKPFVAKQFVQNTLQIKTLSDIADKYISTSPRRKEFEERIDNLTNPTPATAWRQRKRFGL